MRGFGAEQGLKQSRMKAVRCTVPQSSRGATFSGLDVVRIGDALSANDAGRNSMESPVKSNGHLKQQAAPKSKCPQPPLRKRTLSTSSLLDMQGHEEEEYYL